MAQSYEQLKRHTAMLEGKLASRMSSVVELNSQVQEEIAQKNKELTDMRENMKNLREEVEREKMATKDSKKQVRGSSFSLFLIRINIVLRIIK